MTFYERIFDFITDSSKRLSARATIIIFTILIVIIIDNITGFSYYYNKQRQLNQLSTVLSLLKDTTLTPETRSKLLIMEKQCLDRKSIVEHSISFISKNAVSISNKSINPNIPPRNEFWFIASSSGIYLLITLFVVPVLLVSNKKTSFFKMLAVLIVFIIVMSMTSIFNYWLFDKIIPYYLFGNWLWNYVLNFIIQIALFFGIAWMTNFFNKQNN